MWYSMFWKWNEFHYNLQIWQPSGQATRLVHLGTPPSGVRKVPLVWWGEKEMTFQQLNLCVITLFLPSHPASLVSPAVTEHLPEPSQTTGGPCDSPHRHRHHRHWPGSLFQVSTLSSLHVCAFYNEEWGKLISLVGFNFIEKERCSRRSWTFHTHTKMRRSGWTSCHWKRPEKRSSCETLQLVDASYCSFTFLWSSENSISGRWWWPHATCRPSPSRGRCRARWETES